MTMELKNSKGEVIQVFEEGATFGFYLPGVRDPEKAGKRQHALVWGEGKGFRTTLNLHYEAGDGLQIADQWFLMGK